VTYNSTRAKEEQSAFLLVMGASEKRAEFGAHTLPCSENPIFRAWPLFVIDQNISFRPLDYK
jgi:hypothetical protein